MSHLLGVVARNTLGIEASSLVDRLLESDDSRVAEIYAAGIDAQILSLIRGLENIEDKSEGVRFASSTNDTLVDAIRY